MAKLDANGIGIGHKTTGSGNKTAVVARDPSDNTGQQPRPRDQLSRKVRQMLTRGNRGIVGTREAVATALDLHPRTLQRRLHEEGRTFNAIKDELRRGLAVRYLTRSNLQLTEVSARLGYADPAVFSHACRRWFGSSPKDIRQALRDGNNRRIGESVVNGRVIVRDGKAIREQRGRLIRGRQHGRTRVRTS